MKHNWTPLLWELWAAQTLCAVAALVPGSGFCTEPELVWPGLVLSAVVPAAWALWGLYAGPVAVMPQEQLLEPVCPTDLYVWMDLAAVG